VSAPSTQSELGTLADAIPNFRDAGGLATASGRPMQAGVVYRASQLFGLAPELQDALLAIGVTDVFDLRTTSEVDHRPDSLPATITLTVDDVLADRPHSGAAEVATIVNEHADRATVDQINAVVSEGKAKQVMIETYQHFVTLPSAHRAYGGLLTSIAGTRGAAVIHCTAGKDRSGWGIALLQLVAGAEMDDVVADYLLSNEQMRRAYGPMLAAFAAEGGDAESLGHMMLVEPDYLDAALTLMRAQFGDLDGYLSHGLGLTPDDVDTLRTRLLA
jgi:protein-tyrosine phosphatase